MRFVLVLLALGGAGYYWHAQRNAQAQADEVTTIANPIYMQLRMQLQAQGRELDQLLLAQTIDEQDCQSYAQRTKNDLFNRSAGGGMNWTVKAIECTPQLPARYGALFENKPTAVTYLSLARGSADEREARLIYWGVSVEESNRVCDGVTRMQSKRKGTVTCVRAKET